MINLILEIKNYRTCYCHIRNLRRVCQYLPLSIEKTIATALVASRLDCCNSRFDNIAVKDITKLHHVHNCLSRVVTMSPQFICYMSLPV